MDSLIIDDGTVRLRMGEEEDRILAFNPTDIQWARRFEAFQAAFYRAIGTFEQKAKPIDRATKKLTAQVSAIDIELEDLKEQIEALENSETEADGDQEKLADLVNQVEALEQSKAAPQKEMVDLAVQGTNIRQEGCIALLKDLDDLFGAGTSNTVFGDLLSEYAIGSFIEQITPYIVQVRKGKIDKYTAKNSRVLR